MVNKLVLATLLLSTVVFAQDKPKPQPTKLPTIPADYETKFQALFNRQKNAASARHIAQDNYNEADAAFRQVNEDGKALQDELFKKLNLDPKKYAIVDQQDGYSVISEIPETPKPQEKK